MAGRTLTAGASECSTISPQSNARMPDKTRKYCAQWQEAREANAPALFVVRRACSAANGGKSRPNLMEVKGSETQGGHREGGSEGSVEQRYGLMDKNRI